MLMLSNVNSKQCKFQGILMLGGNSNNTTYAIIILSMLGNTKEC